MFVYTNSYLKFKELAGLATSDHATTYKGFLDMIKYLWMWWVIGSAPDFWGRSPGFESGIYHDDPDALQDHCEIK